MNLLYLIFKWHNKIIPKTVCASKSEDYVASGWNEYANEKHEAARQAYLDWFFSEKKHEIRGSSPVC